MSNALGAPEVKVYIDRQPASEGLGDGYPMSISRCSIRLEHADVFLLSLPVPIQADLTICLEEASRPWSMQPELPYRDHRDEMQQCKMALDNSGGFEVRYARKPLQSNTWSETV